MSNDASRVGRYGGPVTTGGSANVSGRRAGAPLLAMLGAVGIHMVVGCSAADEPGPQIGVVTEPQFELVQEELFSAPGAQVIAIADYDRDGLSDIFVGFRQIAPNRLYRNNGDGTFTDVAQEAGLADGADTRAAAWGDFDGDGFADLYVGLTTSTEAPNRLYRNNGDGTFSLVEGVLPDLKGNTRQVSWIDFDNDGALDLFVAFRDRANVLLRNDSGRFTDVAPELGLDDSQRAVGAVWFDANEDGRLDLFVANQDQDLNVFFVSQGDGFVEVAAELGMDGAEQRAGGADHGGVGVSVADFNNDGRLDLFIANYGPNELFLNEGGGRFRDAAPELGLTDDHHSVTARAGDFDNDGRVDIYVTTYLGSDAQIADQFYRNLGDSFVDVFPHNLMTNNASHGVQWLDIDGDGSVDLLSANNADSASHPVYRNVLPPHQARRSLQVMVLDAQGRPTQPGSEVRLYRSGTRELLGTGLVDTGGGYSAQNVMPLHFGLGEYEGTVDVEVTFLTSSGRQVTRVADVQPSDWVGKALSVREGQGQSPR